MFSSTEIKRIPLHHASRFRHRMERALGTQLNVYYEAYDLPGSPSQASASVSVATAGADGGDEVSSGVPPSS
jgi:hypothetical protein